MGRFAISGLAATTLIVLGGVVVGPSPHSSRLPLARPLARLVGRAFGSSGASVIVYLGLALLVGTWLALGRTLQSRGEPRVRVMLALAAIWALPLVLGPPLFSRDVYSYAAQGRMAALGVNPYHHGPAVLGGGELLKGVAPTWAHAKAPYGPLFVGLNAAVGRHAGDNPVAAVVGLRAIELFGVVLLALFLPRLAVRHGVRPANALWLGVLNPLVLLHFVSGAHNDALMVGLLVVGLALAAEGRPMLGLLACTMATAVKAPAALGVAFVALEWAAPGELRDMAWATLARAALVVTVSFVAVAQAVGLGWGWIAAIATPEHIRTLLSPMTDLGIVAGGIARALGFTISSAATISLARAIGLVIAGLTTVVLLGYRRQPGSVRVAGLALLAWVALGPSMQPWYLTWGLVLLAAAGPGRLRPLLVWLSAGVSLLVGPGGSLPDALVVSFVLATGAIAAATRAGWLSPAAWSWWSPAPQRVRQRASSSPSSTSSPAAGS